MPNRKYTPETAALGSVPDADVYKVLDTVSKAGEMLLQNGAELFRVEETMKRIAACYGVTNENIYLLSNGIFLTGDDPKKNKIFSSVRYVPIQGSQFYKVVMINQLSREIPVHHYTIEEVSRRLDEIQNTRGKTRLVEALGYVLTAAAFSILFGGTVKDSLGVLIPGLLLYLYMAFVANPYLSKIVGNLTGSFIVTVICMVAHYLGIGEHLPYMIIGAIAPLIPGTAFVNGARDMANTDYLSGTVRLLDATLSFIGIAVGVGIVYIIRRHIFGGGL